MVSQGLSARINIHHLIGLTDEISNPGITDAQLETLCAYSPLIERHFLRLKVFPDYYWNLYPNDSGATREVLEKLCQPELHQSWLETVKADDGSRSFSRYCEALWTLNVVPERLPRPSYDAWKGHESLQVRTPPRRAAAPSREQRTSRESIASSSSASWIWHEDTGDWDIEWSLSAAHAALILGIKDKFQAEVKLLVGRLRPGHPVATRRANLLGMDKPEGLSDIRLRELSAIQTRIEDFLVRDGGARDKSAKGKSSKDKGKSPHDRIRTRQPGDASGMSIVDYLNRFETNVCEIIWGTSPLTPGPRQSTTFGGPAARVGGPIQSNKVLSKLSGMTATGLAGATGIEGLAKNMFDDVNTFVAQRRDAVAEEIWAWRQACVQQWETVLDERGKSVKSSEKRSAI